MATVKRVADLQDGDRFELRGHTYTCAVVLFGNIAVYLTDARGDDAPTVRIAADSDETVEVRP